MEYFMNMKQYSVYYSYIYWNMLGDEHFYGSELLYKKHSFELTERFWIYY